MLLAIMTPHVVQHKHYRSFNLWTALGLHIRRRPRSKLSDKAKLTRHRRRDRYLYATLNMGLDLCDARQGVHWHRVPHRYSVFLFRIIKNPPPQVWYVRPAHEISRQFRIGSFDMNVCVCVCINIYSILNSHYIESHVSWTQTDIVRSYTFVSLSNKAYYTRNQHQS